MGERLFLGVPLVRSAALRLADRAAMLDARVVRPTPPENYHVTLHFLGDPAPVAVETIVSRMAAVRVPRADTTLTHWGTFPPRGAPRVVWAGFADHPLTDVAAAVRRAMGELGLPVPRRRFTAHVTVGYPRRGTAPGTVLSTVAQAGFGEPIPVRLDRIALIRSRPAPGGSRYEEIASWAAR